MVFQPGTENLSDRCLTDPFLASDNCRPDLVSNNDVSEVSEISDRPTSSFSELTASSE